jgi:hypothetical protein
MAILALNLELNLFLFDIIIPRVSKRILCHFFPYTTVQESGGSADLEYSCESFFIKESTAYEWIRKWNKNGYKGLKDGKRTGRTSKLSDENISVLKTLLEKKDHWDLKEIRELVKDELGVEISLNRLSVALKKNSK